jgi:hypothetical protein
MGSTLISESFVNFLLTVAPAKRRSLLCLSKHQLLPRLGREYERCLFQGDMATAQSPQDFDLIFCPDLTSDWERVNALFPGVVNLADVVMRLTGMLADGGRLVIGLENVGLSTWRQLFALKKLSKIRTIHTVRMYISYPAGARPNLVSCWDKSCLRWFFAQAYPAPDRRLKKLLYDVFVRLGVFAYFAPGYIVEIECASGD